MCASFFSTLECELLARRRFASQAEAKIACFSYIEGFYNPVRLHSALGYRSPITYEQEHAQKANTEA
jgi:putative transposase